MRVWDWRPEYYNPVLDGTSWRVKIHYADRLIESAGSNAYPGWERVEESEEFKRFLGAVRRLAGGMENA